MRMCTCGAYAMPLAPLHGIASTAPHCPTRPARTHQVDSLLQPQAEGARVAARQDAGNGPTHTAAARHAHHTGSEAAGAAAATAWQYAQAGRKPVRHNLKGCGGVGGGSGGSGSDGSAGPAAAGCPYQGL